MEDGGRTPGLCGDLLGFRHGPGIRWLDGLHRDPCTLLPDELVDTRMHDPIAHRVHVADQHAKRDLLPSKEENVPQARDGIRFIEPCAMPDELEDRAEGPFHTIQFIFAELKPELGFRNRTQIVVIHSSMHGRRLLVEVAGTCRSAGRIHYLCIDVNGYGRKMAYFIAMSATEAAPVYQNHLENLLIRGWIPPEPLLLQRIPLPP